MSRAESKGGASSAPRADSKDLQAGAYSQCYIIMKAAKEDKKSEQQDNDVFFKCGLWCYCGLVQFPGVDLTTGELPLIIPSLQKQQSSLRYFCNSSAIPKTCDYAEAYEFYNDAAEFFAGEMTSEAIDDELRRMAEQFPWIDGDGAQTYFELTLADYPKCMDRVALIASKTYTRGLVIVSIYHDGVVYFIVQVGGCWRACLESATVLVSRHTTRPTRLRPRPSPWPPSLSLQSGEGDQPLLDVRFPDVSRHNEGVALQVRVGPPGSLHPVTSRLINPPNMHHNYPWQVRHRPAWEPRVPPTLPPSSHSSLTHRCRPISHPQTYSNPAEPWRKLTLWHVLGDSAPKPLKMPKIRTLSVSSSNYQQTYCVMKSSWDVNAPSISVHHDVLFRFGSWCYAGRVQVGQMARLEMPRVRGNASLTSRHTNPPPTPAVAADAHAHAVGHTVRHPRPAHAAEPSRLLLRRRRRAHELALRRLPRLHAGAPAGLPGYASIAL